MTTNEECITISFDDTTQSQGNKETSMGARTQEGQNSRLPHWLAEFTEFMQNTGQPNAQSSSSADPQDRNAGPLLADHHKLVIRDEWQKVKEIYGTWPALRTTPLNSQEDRPLHLAVSLNRSSIFKGLMGQMTSEELKVRNKEGKTAFFMCADLGNVKFAETMLESSPDLAMIKANGDLFPIHMAAIRGHRQMVRLLNRVTVLDGLGFKLIEELFFMTLENNIFDVGYELLKHCPKLAGSRSTGRLSALHVLARKPQEEFYEANAEPTGSCDRHNLISSLWTAVKFRGRPHMLSFIRRPSHLLFDAAKSGNIEILDLVYQSDPELLMEVDDNKRNLFHIAVLSQQKKVLIHLIEERILADLLMLAVDDGGNNILHLAGNFLPLGKIGSSRPQIQMQRELLRFKDVEKRVPTALKTMRNHDGLTPKEIFKEQHENLHVAAGRAAKETANYGTLEATIIATIVFAASLTVPGHDVSPNADSSILQKKGWYIIFILSNSLALFTSLSATFFFLWIFISSEAEDEFMSLLQGRLRSGIATLLLSATAMVVAFTAVCFWIFNHLSAWVPYLVASLGSVTVAFFVFLFYRLLGDLICSFV